MTSLFLERPLIMLAQAFIQACLNMLIEGVDRCAETLRNAKRVNQNSEMDMPWLVSTLFNVYCILAATVEQVRRFYQFLASGKQTC